MNGYWDGVSYTSSGGYSCSCNTGYVSNTAGTSCVIATKTNDQKCQDSYGSGSNWSGEYNPQGGLSCGCQTEYAWDYGQTQCLQMTPDQLCKRDVGPNSYYLGYKNSNGTYACN